MKAPMNEGQVLTAIDIACDKTKEQYLDASVSSSPSKELRRAQPSDLPRILDFLNSHAVEEPRHVRHQEQENEPPAFQRSWNTVEACRLDVPNFYAIVVTETNKDETRIVGFVSFFTAYSTWDGRVLYLDKMVLPTSSSLSASVKDDAQSTEWSLHYTLSDIAMRLDCARYTWQVSSSDPDWDWIVFRLFES